MMRLTQAVGCFFAIVSVSLGLVAGVGAQSTVVSKVKPPGGLAQPAQAKVHPVPQETPAAAPARDDNGDVIYAQNCSRCHDAPEALNYRITGTVIRHMRTRANLSDADEKALLKFFNAQ